MNILFITNNDFKSPNFGGSRLSQTNYRILESFSNIYVYTVKKRNSFLSFLSLLFFFFPPFFISDFYNIIKLIKKNKFQIIYFDGSLNGRILKRIKKNFPLLRIVLFFHNFEYSYLDVRFKKLTIKKLIYKYICYINEFMSIKYCDYSICLTNRDKTSIDMMYNTNIKAVFPLFLIDLYDNQIQSNNLLENKVLLFGPAQSANIEGFSWFIKNVSPFINAKTILAGKGFESFKTKFNSIKVDVIGTVSNINELYNSVNIVVIPLLSGGGMKIKTAEALMFNKTLIGTKEAFIGYENFFDFGSYIANNSIEFINLINFYLSNPIKEIYKMRKVYLENFSIEVGIKSYKKLIEKLLNKT